MNKTTSDKASRWCSGNGVLTSSGCAHTTSSVHRLTQLETCDMLDALLRIMFPHCGPQGMACVSKTSIPYTASYSLYRTVTLKTRLSN